MVESRTVDPNLSQALEQISQQAATLRGSFVDLSQQDDTAEVAQSGLLLDRFLGDVDEAVRQVFTAGLSYPDPELPEELAALSERAGQLGLAAAMAYLGRLGILIGAVCDQFDIERRLQLANMAWDETLRLVTWMRLFKSEFGFLVVASRLSGGSNKPVVEKRADTYETRTCSVWPVGFELERNGKLIIFGLDVDSSALVVLRDHLSEFNKSNPFDGKAVSRLLQNSVDLGQVLSSLLRLEDHPVVKKKGSLLFRPAFRAIPKIVEVTEDFQRPQLHAWEDGEIKKQTHPVALRAKLELKGGRLRWQAPAAMEVPAIARFNLTKLMLREGRQQLELDLAVRLVDESLRILSVTTDDDGRVFPLHDPALFRVAVRRLLQRADQTASLLADVPIVAVWLRAAAYLFGGEKQDRVDELRQELEQVPCQGIEAHYQKYLVGFLLGADLPNQEMRDIVGDVFTLATLDQSQAIPLDALSRVLGWQATASDIRHLDDAVVYQALWLTFQCELLQEFRDKVTLVLQKRFSGKLKSPSPSTICARALALYLLQDGADCGAAQDPVQDDPVQDDPVQEDPIQEEMAQDEEDESEEEPENPALEFLLAYLQDYQPGARRRRKKRPLPELLELYQFGDTLAIVADQQRHANVVSELGVERLLLAQMCTDALLSWSLAPEDIGAAAQAADAMLVIAASGLREWMVYA